MKLAVINIGSTFLYNQRPSFEVAFRTQAEQLVTPIFEAIVSCEDFKPLDLSFQSEHAAKFVNILVSKLLQDAVREGNELQSPTIQLSQLIAETLCDNFIQGLKPEKTLTVEKFCCAILAKQQELVLQPEYHYDVAQFGIDIIKKLREEYGLKVVACTNTTNPERYITFFKNSGINIEELFDDFIVSENNVRMPDPKFFDQLLSKYGLHETPWLSFIVGDQLQKCLSCGHMSGMRNVYFSDVTPHRHANYKAMSLGQYPDFSILDFRQLRYVVEVMNADVVYINSLGTFNREYRQKKDLFKSLPSQNRIKVGLLVDGDIVIQKELFWRIGLMREDKNFAFTAFAIDDPYHNALNHTNIDVVIQKLRDLPIPGTGSESFIDDTMESIWLLKQWSEKNKIPIIDDLESSMILRNRLLFLRNLDLAINKLRIENPDKEIYQRIRTSNYATVHLKGQKDGGIADKATVLKALQDHQIQYPFVIKVVAASRNKYAHSFYVISAEQGLDDALKFEGFQDNQVILQQWINHHEQLYKLYCVGANNHSHVITTSVPQKLIREAENGAFFFQTSMKFQASDYTSFDPNEDRLTQEVKTVVARDICSGCFGLDLVGVDMLIEEKTGNVYLIDINYFSSYKGVANLDVEACFKELIAEKNQKSKLSKINGSFSLVHPVSEREETKEMDQF